MYLFTQQGAGNAISFENQVIAYETYAADVIFQFGADEAMLSLSGAIYHVNFGSADILAYFTKPAYATTAGTVSKFIDGLAFEYQRMIEVSLSHFFPKTIWQWTLPNGY